MEFTRPARGFFCITLTAVAAFLVAAYVSVGLRDWPFMDGASARHVHNVTGPFGSFLAWSAFELFGRVFAWLLPLALVGMAVNALRPAPAVRRWAAKSVVIVILLNAIFAITPLSRENIALHGRIGDGIAAALQVVFGEIGSTIVLVTAVLLIGLGEIAYMARFAWGGVRGAQGVSRPLVGLWSSLADRMRAQLADVRGRAAERAAEREAGRTVTVEAAEPLVVSQEAPAEAEKPMERLVPARAAGSSAVSISTHGLPAARRQEKSVSHARPRDGKRRPLSESSLPSPAMLQQGDDSGATYTKDELKNWSTVLEEKLVNYGVQGKVTAVHHGPVVTTFEFEPAPGVRIKEIVNRADDLALAMRARSLRMIAPIPGRAVVGIEIPNPKSRMVYLYDVLSQITERQRLSGVMIALGVDVSGRPFAMNLCDAPHMMVAGTTGSGKSVCLNSILASILFQYRPSEVQLLLVDPKIVELSLYNGIPHLMHPVITDPKEAGRVLEYLVAEMRRRNELFKRHGVRNLESYNVKVAMGGKVIADGEPMEKLPYIVVVIDEFGDLALAKGVDIETLLARLAQMARAAGIHMILATQRPSVDVVVGKTKANFPTRIAFRVATKVDSRTILDTIGADKLLGKGDMLYMDAQHPQPLRLHGAWVAENELVQLVDHWKSFEFDDGSLELDAARAGAAEIDDDVDPLFNDAKGIVYQFKQGSTSLLQRKLHVGYARAARLLDQLEQRGIVGPPDGSKPREVYGNREDGGAAA